MLVTEIHDARQTARDDAADLRGYLVELGDLLPDRQPAGGEGGHRKVSGSPAPWNTGVADLLLDIHAGARQEQRDLLTALGLPRRPLGSGDAATMRCLSDIPILAEAVEDGPAAYCLLALGARRRLGRWAWRCRQALDQLRPGEQPWTRAPGGLRCPNPWDARAADRIERQGVAGSTDLCDRPLWLQPGWQYLTQPPVFCLRCTDSLGLPYAWPHAAWVLVVAGTPTR